MRPAIRAITSGTPITAAATPLAAAIPKMMAATTAINTRAPITSSTVKPISAHSRRRSRCHASPMVMLEPNTALPTTTVSMPLNRIPDSQVATPPARLDTDEPISAPVETSSPLSVGSSSPVTASGPSEKMSATICAATTTMVVNPSVALGFARM